jgi:uncharacterized protein (DUF983 family)
VLLVTTARKLEFACPRCHSRKLFRANTFAVVDDLMLCKGCGLYLAAQVSAG